MAPLDTWSQLGKHTALDLDLEDQGYYGPATDAFSRNDRAGSDTG